MNKKFIQNFCKELNTPAFWLPTAFFSTMVGGLIIGLYGTGLKGNYWDRALQGSVIVGIAICMLILLGGLVAIFCDSINSAWKAAAYRRDEPKRQAEWEARVAEHEKIRKEKTPSSLS